MPGYIEYRLGGSNITPESIILAKRRTDPKFDKNYHLYSVAYVQKRKIEAGAGYPTYDCFFYNKCEKRKLFVLAFGHLCVSVSAADVRGIFTQAQPNRDLSQIMMSRENYKKLPLEWII